MNLTFNRAYFFTAFILLLLEIFIALYVRDSFFRPYGGDFFALVLLYCLLKSFWKIPFKNAIFGALLFLIFIEWLQYVKVLEFLQIHKNRFLATVLGNYFEWLDIAIYCLAALSIYGFERLRHRETSEVKTPGSL
ncbi:ribosomal maturation YjgA family protein [Salinimicrobium oceani]|uniref:DUF2809 domain-containing protein n=1 Tax=Salinimicrobium oceani TaxID=2722702 RepID=A0ABX1D004_9FLAO|nr:DUF2809 domain-containing protein [Salinimicrobium oceani]NJW53826.1 DUF2809 domain-containing protein [Salinimicrobium oceani]